MAENNKDTYLSSILNNKEVFQEYYAKSFVKTEQQKFLENLLLPFKKEQHLKIADVASGGGSLSFHLNAYFSNAEFWCSDYSEIAVDSLKEKLKLPNFHVSQENIYQLNAYNDNFFDFTFCWMTLSWLDEPEKALEQLIRITKPGGKIFLSSLFNLSHDVDLYTKIVDHSSDDSTKIIHANYSTFSTKTIRTWTTGKVMSIDFHPFHPDIDFQFEGRGIGTYTEKLANGKRLQFSAGLHLNWAILELTK